MTSRPRSAPVNSIELSTMSMSSDSRSRASETRAIASSSTWTVLRSRPASPVRNCVLAGPAPPPAAPAAAPSPARAASPGTAASVDAEGFFFRRKNIGARVYSSADGHHCGKIPCAGAASERKMPGQTASHTGEDMQVTVEPRDNFTILHLRGEFDTFYCALLQKEIDGLVAQGVNRIALNMRLVKFINSTAQIGRASCRERV